MDEKTKYRLIKSLTNYLMDTTDWPRLNWNQNQQIGYITTQIMMMLKWFSQQGHIELDESEIHSIVLGFIYDEYWDEVTQS